MKVFIFKAQTIRYALESGLEDVYCLRADIFATLWTHNCIDGRVSMINLIPIVRPQYFDQKFCYFT